MTTAVYFCRCGGIVSDRIDPEAVGAALAERPGIVYRVIDLACSEQGQEEMVAELAALRPDRVVVAACSPREHEETFRGVLARAGLNPFLMQMVNVREHVAWVTPDPAEATAKAITALRAAVARVAHHEPLEKREVEISTAVLVIGGGPAGLKAALTLAEAGRKVTVVEKGPILGGMPVLIEEIFPRLECGPCILEPFIAEALHGPHAENVTIRLMSDVTAVTGSFGNFNATIRTRPRYVDMDACIGCAECIAPCPASAPNPANCGLSDRKAMDFVFYGGLPNAPYLDMEACVRSRGEACTACRDACPIEGAVRLDDAVREETLTFGAVLVATGGGLGDVARLPHLGGGCLPGVVTSLEFERLLAGTGPTGGEVQVGGRAPASVAIVHCAGSLDPENTPYCSGVCCPAAFKYNLLLEHKLPEAAVTHYTRTVVLPGKAEHELYRKATARAATRLVPYAGPADIAVEAGEDGRPVVRRGSDAEAYDLVILMPPIVPGRDTAKLAGVLGIARDALGFFEEGHGVTQSVQSKVRGIFVAGACQAPTDIAGAMLRGSAAAAGVLAALVPGRRLELEVVQAHVDEARCSGCTSCVGVCPYRALSMTAAAEDGGSARARATVDPVLCVGCGTCVAGCPANAITGRHFTNEQVMAELEGALR